MALNLNESREGGAAQQPWFRKVGVERSMHETYRLRASAQADVTRSRFLAVFRRTLMRGQGARRRS